MIVTSTITMDTDCGRTPLEHLRAIGAVQNNKSLRYQPEMGYRMIDVQDEEIREVVYRHIRIELLDELIKLERNGK